MGDQQSLNGSSAIPPRSSTNSSRSSLSRRLSSFFSRRPTDRDSPRSVNEFGLNTLFNPEEHGTTVVADFVFVHGLGGGSNKTWSIKYSPESFWPKEWLPQDPSFEGVRIHSFGYNASWASWLQNPLDIHAFGEYLVQELLSHPQIRTQDTRIVLIGHSMGGLVIKKACILFKTTQSFTDMANRLHSFYFMGTPHRGSNLAGTLNNLLRMFGTGGRAYIAGLETKSEMIRVLSDGFRDHYSGIHLHTFYESLPTPPVGMIVEIESATLGYAEERSQLMNANHRDLVKFESIHDSNYRSFKNRLASTVQQIRDELRRDPQNTSFPPESTLSPQPDQVYSEQMGAIGKYLTTDSCQYDLPTLDYTRIDGSCSWLTLKPSFQEWRYSSDPRYFWLKGPPACGKSTIASYMLEYLIEHPVCSYFFKTGENTASSLGSFLRSIAYQMAAANESIRDELVQLSQQGRPLDIRNQRSIWHNVFMGCLFKVKLDKPHFWIIDALDEAADQSPVDELFLLLSKISSGIPLKIFITSRSSYVLDNLFAHLSTNIELVTPDDLRDDIQRYVEAWSENIPFTDAEEQQKNIEEIVKASGGNFLWTVLIMRKLREVITVEEAQEVLREVPQKMSELYLHNIRRMESSRSKDPAKHIMTWALCSLHTLTVDQMKDAVKLSLGTTLARDLRKNLHSLCGQFLDIDKKSRIQVLHETARAFLTSPDLDSEFRVDYSDGHGLIAKTCLRYLLSDELHYAKRPRGSSSAGATKNAMAHYACLHFSEHVLRTSPSSDELFEMLVKFFNTNVLSWIENVVQLGDLDCLNRTSRHLSNYLSRRVEYVPLISSNLDAWAIDLPRIVTQFGVNLLSYPAAIHTLVPPFCPRGSAIHRHFGHVEGGIKLIGARNPRWGDQVCSIYYHEMYPRYITARDHRFAVGLSEGSVKLYRTSTCEELLTLAHGESISLLEFGVTSKLIASAGIRNVRLWDAVNGEQLFRIPVDSQTLALAFNEDETRLIVASRNKQISEYQIPDGSKSKQHLWTDPFEDGTEFNFSPSPSAAEISIEHDAIAIIYRGRPVQLWSLKYERPIGACIRPGTRKHRSANHIVNCVAIHPNAMTPRLLICYWDEVMVTFDIITCKPLASTSAGLDRIAIAPNGKTFAGSDATGAIKIFDFETLQCLHKVGVQGTTITGLTFASDSLKVIDTRATQADVWEPLVLVSQDSYSQTGEPSQSLPRILEEELDGSVVNESSAISALYCCEQSGVAFCGRNNGRVDTCNLDEPGNTMRDLYRHRGTFTSVICIDWCHEQRISASADSSGSFRIMKISTGTPGEWSAKILMEARCEQGRAVRQVLLHPEGSFVLVSSTTSDSVWSLATKQKVAEIKSPKRMTWKWFVRPATPSQLLLFEDEVVKLFNWDDLFQLAVSETPRVSVQDERRGSEADSQADAISISSEGDDLVLVQRVLPSPQALYVTPYQSRAPAASKVHIFDISALSDTTHATAHSSIQSTPRENATPLPSQISMPNPPPSLRDPFSPTSTTLTITQSSLQSQSPLINQADRSSSVWSVADIPDVASIIGTVKRFNWWYLVFLSKENWVCSVELRKGGRKGVGTFQKHFFVPSIWRTGNSSIITKVRSNQDIVFVHFDSILVVKNGLDNGEHVSLP